MNLNTNGLKKHFLNVKIKKEELKKPKTKTKIKNYCFYSINEANISNKIKKIPYYSNYYNILEDYDFINISTFDEKMIEKIKLLDENKKYLLFKYRPYSYSFDDFLFEFKKPKDLIFNIILSFSYLLQGLLQLENQKLVFFQLSHENIVFEENCREKPLLTDFQLSLQVSKLNEEYITQIIKKTSDYSLKPLEVHILFYLIENDMTTISYSFIEEIVEVFIKKLEIISFFSQNDRENYQKSCVDYLKKYINKPKKEIILDILNNYKKWDIYSISVLYLHVFHNISIVFSLKQTFINEIMRELAKNIHPDPSKRNSLSELLETSKKLLNCDWTFINVLEDEKIDRLWKN
jgi:hypothetical protein